MGACGLRDRRDEILCPPPPPPPQPTHPPTHPPPLPPGKGVTASSLGLLLKMMGMRPTAIKIDPYLNVDAGTMSPFEHGEVFVLDDGGETGTSSTHPPTHLPMYVLIFT